MNNSLPPNSWPPNTQLSSQITSQLYAQLPELLNRHGELIVITVVSATGSTPRKAGARMVVLPNGEIIGTIGGGVVEHRLQQFSLGCLSGHAIGGEGESASLHASSPVSFPALPTLHTINLTTELAMCCGGTMQFFIERLEQQPHLIVLGCGHVGRALIRQALLLGFQTTAIDDLESNLEQLKIAPAAVAPANNSIYANIDDSTDTGLPPLLSILDSYAADDLEQLTLHTNSLIVIATREHAIDQKLLEYFLPLPHRYMGVIGSKRKAAMQRERLAAKGFDQSLIEKIHCPMGIDIGAQSPAEIAVSILAELIQVMRCKAK